MLILFILVTSIVLKVKFDPYTFYTLLIVGGCQLVQIVHSTFFVVVVQFVFWDGACKLAGVDL